MSDTPTLHSTLRKDEAEEVAKAEEQQLEEAKTLASADAQAELNSSQSILKVDLSSTGTEKKGTF